MLTLPKSKTGLVKWAKNNTGKVLYSHQKVKFVSETGRTINEGFEWKNKERVIAKTQNNAVLFHSETGFSYLYIDQIDDEWSFDEKGFSNGTKRVNRGKVGDYEKGIPQLEGLPEDEKIFLETTLYYTYEEK